MGGGGAMRAASKLAGISTYTSTFRSGGGSVVETPVAAVARKTVRPLSATVCDGGTKIEQSVQRPAWELDDWEFLNEQQLEKDELFVQDKYGQVVEKLPRVVFGTVPSFEEAKEATSQLKDALEKVYLTSPKSSGSAGSLSSLHETKACITHESSVSEGALQAFMLLKESPAAQTVVASIASDPNVWTAVMQNPTLVEFLESDRKYADSKIQEACKSPVDAESGAQGSPKSSVDIDDAEESGKSDGFTGLIQDVKTTVVDMVNKVTSFVESWFNFPVGEKSETSDDSPKTFFAGGTFMALAMMVIMVVLMKRN